MVHCGRYSEQIQTSAVAVQRKAGRSVHGEDPGTTENQSPGSLATSSAIGLPCRQVEAVNRSRCLCSHQPHHVIDLPWALTHSHHNVKPPELEAHELIQELAGGLLAGWGVLAIVNLKWGSTTSTTTGVGPCRFAMGQCHWSLQKGCVTLR